jgi:hypothetical protein
MSYYVLLVISSNVIKIVFENSCQAISLRRSTSVSISSIIWPVTGVAPANSPYAKSFVKSFGSGGSRKDSGGTFQLSRVTKIFSADPFSARRSKIWLWLLYDCRSVTESGRG